MRTRTAAAIGALLSAGLLLTGCGLQPTASYVPEVGPGSIEPIPELGDDAKLTITSKNFTEQLVLGKIAVIAAEAAGFSVTDLTNVPGSRPARELMASGQADMMWEYTGTAWLSYLGQSDGIPDQELQWEAVKEADARHQLVWGRPAPLNNTYAIAMRTEAAQQLGIETISDITTLPEEERTFCVESEFNSRTDGFNPMLETYGMVRGEKGGVSEDGIGIYDTGAVYTATDQGQCNFGEVFATDGRIDALDLTVLHDDRAFFPAYNAAPVFYGPTLEKHPQLDEVFAGISPLLTDEVLRSLNLRVDVGGEEPAGVAFSWMVEQGFITDPGA